MKATGQPWCIYPRNGIDGIFYVQLKNKETGNYMTAKSTGTRDRNEATRIASRCWTEYDKTGAVSYKPSNSMMDAADYQMKALDEKITAYTQTAIDTIVQSVQTVSFNKNTPQPYSISAAEYEDAPEEVKPLLSRLSTLTFMTTFFFTGIMRKVLSLRARYGQAQLRQILSGFTIIQPASKNMSSIFLLACLPK